MKILNLIWGFSLGAGIDKCFLTYAALGDAAPGLRVCSVCIDIESLDSHTEPLEKIGGIFIRIKNKRDFSWVGKLNELISRERPDVIFTHGFNGAIMMLIERLVKKQRTPLVCSYHGAYQAPTRLKKLLEPIYNALPVYVYKKYARRVICVENVSRRRLIEKGVPESKVVTVYNGIRDLAPAPADLSSYPHDGPAIMTASRITEIKGLPDLLDALKILRDRGVAFHYFMIGEGPDLESLRLRTRELGLEDRVTFAGFRPNVPAWLAACDIFALPSLSECHSIAILEAMRAGKAIVATDVGGNGESIRNHRDGILVPPQNCEALAEALLRVIRDPSLRKTLGDSARRRFLETFTEEAMQRNLLKALEV